MLTGSSDQIIIDHWPLVFCARLSQGGIQHDDHCYHCCNHCVSNQGEECDKIEAMGVTTEPLTIGTGVTDKLELWK